MKLFDDSEKEKKAASLQAAQASCCRCLPLPSGISTKIGTSPSPPRETIASIMSCHKRHPMKNPALPYLSSCI